MLDQYEIIVKKGKRTTYIPLCPCCCTEMETYIHPILSLKHVKCNECGYVVKRIDRYTRHDILIEFLDTIKKLNLSQIPNKNV